MLNWNQNSMTRKLQVLLDLVNGPFAIVKYEQVPIETIMWVSVLGYSNKKHCSGATTLGFLTSLAFDSSFLHLCWYLRPWIFCL